MVWILGENSSQEYTKNILRYFCVVGEMNFELSKNRCYLAIKESIRLSKVSLDLSFSNLRTAKEMIYELYILF